MPEQTKNSSPTYYSKKIKQYHNHYDRKVRSHTDMLGHD